MGTRTKKSSSVNGITIKQCKLLKRAKVVALAQVHAAEALPARRASVSRHRSGPITMTTTAMDPRHTLHPQITGPVTVTRVLENQPGECDLRQRARSPKSVPLPTTPTLFASRHPKQTRRIRALNTVSDRRSPRSRRTLLRAKPPRTPLPSKFRLSNRINTRKMVRRRADSYKMRKLKSPRMKTKLRHLLPTNVPRPPRKVSPSKRTRKTRKKKRMKTKKKLRGSVVKVTLTG